MFRFVVQIKRKVFLKDRHLRKKVHWKECMRMNKNTADNEQSSKTTDETGIEFMLLKMRPPISTE